MSYASSQGDWVRCANPHTPMVVWRAPPKGVASNASIPVQRGSTHSTQSPLNTPGQRTVQPDLGQCTNEAHQCHASMVDIAIFKISLKRRLGDPVQLGIEPGGTR